MLPHMSTSLSFVRAGAIALIAIAVLAGCGRNYVTISGKESYLPACTGIGIITMEELDGQSPPACAPYGSSVVFPDGQQIEFRKGVAVAGFHSYPLSYALYYFGIYGIAVAYTNDTGTHFRGHTERAIELAKEVIRTG